jgi:hypothetical protein
VADFSISKSAALTPILSGNQLTQTSRLRTTARLSETEVVPLAFKCWRPSARVPRLDQHWVDMLADYLAKVGRHRPIEAAGSSRQRTPAGVPPGRGKRVSASQTAEQVTTPGRSCPHTFLAQLVCGGTLAQGSAGCLDRAA